MKFLLILFFPVFVFSQISFEKINEKTKKLAIKYLDKEEIPAMSITISYNDTIIFSEGFGYADLENKTTVIPSKTKFEIASITKMITASILGKMSEDGIINLNNSPYFYLDSLSKKQYDFTIKQLAGHIAGLKRDVSEENWELKNTYSKKDFYSVFKKDSILCEPTTKFSYSNYGFKVLGFVIEKIKNKNLFEVQKEYIYTPLKMGNTKINNGIYDENTVCFYKHSEGKLKKITDYLYNDSCYAEGCNLSTSEDLIKLGNSFLFVNRLLKPETLKELIISQKLIDGAKTNYGIGIMSGKDILGNCYFGHGGNSISARSELKIYPNSKLVIVMLANKSKNEEDDLVEKIASNYIEFLKK
jgi:serine beta-lactamase-like protein LACTB